MPVIDDPVEIFVWLAEKLRDVDKAVKCLEDCYRKGSLTVRIRGYKMVRLECNQKTARLMYSRY